MVIRLRTPADYAFTLGIRYVCVDGCDASLRRRGRQERRQQRKAPVQEKKEAGVRVRSRAAARSGPPRPSEEVEYKRVYKPRVRIFDLVHVSGRYTSQVNVRIKHGPRKGGYALKAIYTAVSA